MLDQFREVVVVDFEFTATSGNRPEPVSLVAHELKSDRVIRLWRDQFGPVPPYSTTPDTLFVAYYASAEIGCHRALGWPIPARILDLFTEFRARCNGLPTIAGNGLIGALTHFGLDSIGAAEKTEMRDLILRGGPWSPQERADILDYNESDVVALKRLLPAMLPGIDLPRALLRGRYMAVAAVMEYNGVPIDTVMLERLRRGWLLIQDKLIAEIDADYGVFDGRTFKADRFAVWLARNQIPWPRLDSGRLDLGDDTFRQMARAHPSVAPLRELRSALADLRLSDLAVGTDGRNRSLPRSHRTQSAEQFEVHLRSRHLDPLSDQAATGLCRGLHRLVAARVRNRRRLIRRQGNVGCIRIRRSVFGVRQAGRHSARGRNQTIAWAAARAVQAGRACDPIRYGGRKPRDAPRATAGRGS